jgi:pilus assembly protein CpaC
MNFIKSLAVIAIAAACAWPAAANGDRTSARQIEQAGSVLHIATRNGPTTRKVSLGSGKSMMVEFGFDLRDVLVADPERVDAVVQTSNRVFLIAKKNGQTNAFFFDANGDRVLTLEISVGADLTGIDDLLKRLIPGSQIKTEVAGDAIVLTGSVRSPADSNRASVIASKFTADSIEVGMSPMGGMAGGGAQGGGNNGGGNGNGQKQSSSSSGQRVINLLAVEAEEQVMLRVVVAEVQRDTMKQFGVNIGAVINEGNFTTAILSANGLPLTGPALGNLPIPGVIPGTGGLVNNLDAAGSGSVKNSGIAGVQGGVGKNQLSHALRALERDGLIKTLAEPNLTAISGEPAKFLAGGEIPFVTGIDRETGARTVEYKEFGVQLAFTPVVLSEGRISLKIDTAVSEIAEFIGDVPVLNKRQARTTVELPSGGSLALAGLISEDTRQNIDGFPGLKDMPVLGTLFRSRDYQKKETELVVIVTPYTVRPTARKELSAPTDGLGAATDREANFLGHINKVYGRESVQPPGDLKGDYGYIVE